MRPPPPSRPNGGRVPRGPHPPPVTALCFRPWGRACPGPFAPAASPRPASRVRLGAPHGVRQRRPHRRCDGGSFRGGSFRGRRALSPAPALGLPVSSRPCASGSRTGVCLGPCPPVPAPRRVPRGGTASRSGAAGIRVLTGRAACEVPAPPHLGDTRSVPGFGSCCLFRGRPGGCEAVSPGPPVTRPRHLFVGVLASACLPPGHAHSNPCPFCGVTWAFPSRQPPSGRPSHSFTHSFVRSHHPPRGEGPDGAESDRGDLPELMPPPQLPPRPRSGTLSTPGLSLVTTEEGRRPHLTGRKPSRRCSSPLLSPRAGQPGPTPGAPLHCAGRGGPDAKGSQGATPLSRGWKTWCT